MADDENKIKDIENSEVRKDIPKSEWEVKMVKGMLRLVPKIDVLLGRVETVFYPFGTSNDRNSINKPEGTIEDNNP